MHGRELMLAGEDDRWQAIITHGRTGVNMPQLADSSNRVVADVVDVVVGILLHDSC